MLELLILFLLIFSAIPSFLTWFVLGGCMHAVAIVLYDWGRDTIDKLKVMTGRLQQRIILF